MWLETEGALEWITQYASLHTTTFSFPPAIPPPKSLVLETEIAGDCQASLSSASLGASSSGGEEGAKIDSVGDATPLQGTSSCANEEDDDGEEQAMGEEEMLDMYLNMYQTAIDMIVAGL